MAIIGYNSIGGSTPTLTSSSTQRLIDNATYVYTAAANQEVFRLWFYTGGLNGNGSGVEVGVYDITSGTASAPRVATGTISTLTTNDWTSVDITPVALTEGNDYAVAVRCISSTDVSARSTYVTGGVSQSSLTGASALASTWTDNASSGDVLSVYAETQTASASFAIDSTDASMQRNGTFDVTFSNPATTPTTGNTSLAQGGDTLTCTGVTGSDPYTATFSVGDLTKQVDATGYDWTLTVDAESDTTGNIPLTIQSGYTKVDLASPVTTNASLLFGYSGDAPVTGDDLEYDVTSTLDSGVTFSVATDGVWTVTESSPGDWTTDITVDRRVVQANGTIGSTQEITLSAAEPSAPVMPADTSVDVAENATTVGTFAASSGSPAPTYSLSGTDAALFSINSSTAAVTFDSAPDYESDPLSYSITVTATNSEGSDSQNITVNVTNVVETPVLASTLALSGTVDSALSRTLSIQSGDAATSWNVTGGADQGSYSINSSGVLSRTAPNDTAEDEVVTVTATNSAGTSNTQTVTITYSVSAGDGIVTDIVRDMVSNIVTDMVN